MSGYYLSGAAEMQRDSATNYREFCAMPVDPEVQRMVTVDLPRTFANNLLFSTGPAGEAPYVEMLRSILFATSQSRSDVKYCQGLNYIAALLLLVQRDEEKAVLDIECDHESCLLQGLLQRTTHGSAY